MNLHLILYHEMWKNGQRIVNSRYLYTNVHVYLKRLVFFKGSLQYRRKVFQWQSTSYLSIYLLLCSIPEIDIFFECIIYIIYANFKVCNKLRFFVGKKNTLPFKCEHKLLLPVEHAEYYINNKLWWSFRWFVWSKKVCLCVREMLRTDITG